MQQPNVQPNLQPNIQVQSTFGAGMFAGAAKFIDFAHINQQSVASNTLDEPIFDTVVIKFYNLIMEKFRDLSMIAHKIKFVLLPFQKDEHRQLRNWDLWGPLLICLGLSMTLGINSQQGADIIFGTIFFIMWGGAAIITINARLLGGQVSFFQSVCTLGYCVFPILIAALVIAFGQHIFGFLARLGITTFAFFWSCKSSLMFMGSMMNEEKKMISVYPIFLFYLFLAWFCIFI